MKLAIHQPDFLPWLGFFHKVVQADKLIVFDHVQAPRGKSWLTRNRILLDGETRWLTLPIKRNSTQKIYEVLINQEVNFKQKHLGTIKHAYAKSKFFDEVYPVVVDIYNYASEFAMDFSLNAILVLLDNMDFNIEIEHSTRIAFNNPNLNELGSNELVLEICKLTKTEEYLSGTGCLDFIKPDKFNEAGIKFFFQNFQFNEYHQVNSKKFISNLSILDPLFNIGFDSVREILKQKMEISPEEYFLTNNKNI